MKPQTIIATGAIFAFLGVALGAMGAHAVKPLISAEQLGNYQTGALYQFIHALGLLFLGLYTRQNPHKLLTIAAYLFAIGIFCFSGSLYLLSTRTVTGLPVSWLGPITPLGGILFMSGWILIAYQTLNSHGK